MINNVNNIRIFALSRIFYNFLREHLCVHVPLKLVVRVSDYVLTLKKGANYHMHGILNKLNCVQKYPYFYISSVTMTEDLDDSDSLLMIS